MREEDPNRASLSADSVRRRAPILRSALAPAVIGFLYLGASITDVFQKTIVPVSLEFNAKLAAQLLRCLGEDATAIGDRIEATRVVLRFGYGCDALDASVLYMLAVLASPATLLLRLVGAFAGAILLLALNQVRTTSLYYTKLHFPDAFDLMHLDVWQVLYIFGAVCLWLLWVSWALRRGRARL